MEKNEFFTDFVVGGNKTSEGKVWREKIQKMKIYKRLKVDKMFPKKEFFGQKTLKIKILSYYEGFIYLYTANNFKDY